MGLELSNRVISGFHTEGSHAVEFLNLFLETLISSGPALEAECSVYELLGAASPLEFKIVPSGYVSRQQPQSLLRANKSPIICHVMKD